jgi:DNA end-binding protein Ku
MARPYWSGQVTISLVSFGVKLFVATEAKSEIRFHQIDRRSGERVRHQKVLSSAVESAPDEPAEPVGNSEIVKGYEYSKGHYVTIEPEEIAHLRVPSRHTMEVAQFVSESELPPEYFEKPYFVVPENDAQTEAFLTVRKALQETKKVAITKIAFGGREHLVALTPAGTDEHGGMMAYIMRYAAELRDPAEYFGDVKHKSINKESLELAKELIKRRTAKFNPSKFVDGYEVALKELVNAKLKHLPIPQEEETKPSKGKVVNLMDALRKSVRNGDTETPARRSSTKSASTSKKPAARHGLALVKGHSKARTEAKSSTRATSKRKSA